MINTYEPAGTGLSRTVVSRFWGALFGHRQVIVVKCIRLLHTHTHTHTKEKQGKTSLLKPTVVSKCLPVEKKKKKPLAVCHSVERALSTMKGPVAQASHAFIDFSRLH